MDEYEKHREAGKLLQPPSSSSSSSVSLPGSVLSRDSSEGSGKQGRETRNEEGNHPVYVYIDRTQEERHKSIVGNAANHTAERPKAPYHRYM